MKRRLRILLLPLLLAALLPLASTLARDDVPSSQALIRIDIRSEADLQVVIAAGLPVYAWLESAQGGSYLLAYAASNEQAALAVAGLSIRSLDPDVSEAAYYLLIAPQSKALEQARTVTDLLDVDGLQAVARLSSQQLEALAPLGIEVDRLGPQPIVLARDSLPRSPRVVTPDPVVQQMIDLITPTQVSDYDRQLAGELPVWVDGEWYNIPSRYTYSGVPIQKATNYVGQYMAGFGLDVEYHVWGGTTYPNVIGEKVGLTNPDDIFIIGGHIDAVQGSPGADDNGSGSVATMLAAEILSQYNWACTLRFAFWTGEEQGLLGSDVYAQRAYNNGENIVGYLNMDMIAYNTIGSAWGIDLIYHSGMPETHELALLYSDVVEAYNLGLIPELRTSLGGGSDHQSFWDRGYTSILAIEDQSDFNPYYHSSGDTPAHTDLAYFTAFVKASIAAFVHDTGCLLPSTGRLQGVVTDQVSGAPVADAAVQAHYNPYIAFAAASGDDGAYGMDVAAGTYTVTAWSPGYMITIVPGVLVSEGLTTTLDVSLQVTPTYTITGFVLEAVSGRPISTTVTVVGEALPPVHTDPATGYYTLALLQDSYTLYAAGDVDHLPQEQVVHLDGDKQVDFGLERVCLLVIDDDQGQDYETYYTAALDALGYDYRLASQPPDLATLAFYGGVIWLTGDQALDTLTAADQSMLTTYLDGGGRLFLSGQDIGEEIGTTDFYANYLHAALASVDVDNTRLSGVDFLNGLWLFLNGGDGASNQTSQDGLSPVNGGFVALDYRDTPDQHIYASVAYSGTYRMVYFGIGYEGINRAVDRRSAMNGVMNFLDACALPQPPQAAFDTFLTPETVQFTNASLGSPLMTYTWDFGDDSPLGFDTHPVHVYTQTGEYTVVLTATSPYGVDVASQVITVTEVCEPLSPPDFTFLPLQPVVGEAVEFTAVITGALPVTYTWNFGDGTLPATGNGLSVITHTFAAADTTSFTVTLTVANDCAIPQSVSRPVTVTLVLPQYEVYLPILLKAGP